MMCNWLKNKSLELAKKGGENFLSALKKFFKDSQLINEIHDRADKELFLAAASSKQYHHIESIKENDIYDKFIEMCFDRQTLGVDVVNFVETHYSRKRKSTKKYIVWFFNELNMIIFDVLKNNASSETKIILRGQEIGFSQILTKLAHIENRLTENTNPPTTVITYCANMQNSRWNFQNYEKALADRQIINTISLSLSNSTHSSDLKSPSPSNSDKWFSPLLNNSMISSISILPLPVLS